MLRQSLILIFFLVCCHWSNAQKVGLVLSGGGSKGVAHIGVIRALEEEEIPIDYITGTSMGAIIGGLYAAGYTPDEMVHIINSKEFEYWSTGTIDPRYTYFFNMPPKTAGWIDLKFYNDSILRPTLPTNIVSPMVMDFAFLELFSSASAVSKYDFNNLMVPFRCIASDIVKAEQVVLSKGSLGQAIRASMTFPFYFKPIKIDSVLLFDGGMYNNFPADVMLDHFFPDIIIGSQVSNNAKAPGSDNVLSQLENMLMTKTNFDVICDNSVLIRPTVKSVNVIDFSNNKAFLDSGYVATKRAIPEIRKFLTVRRTQSQLDSIRTSFNMNKPELLIDNIVINGLQKGQHQYLEQLLIHESQGSSIPGISKVPLTLNMVKPQYHRFLAERKVSSIYPSLQYDYTRNTFDLNLDIEKQNQLVTEIGGAITSSSVNELFLQLKYLLWTSKSIQFTANSYFGRFYNSALAETRIDFPSYNPYSVSVGFIFNKFNYFKTSTFFYSDEDPFFVIEQEQFGYINIAFPVRHTGKISIDLPFGSSRDRYYQTNLYQKDDITDRTSFRFISPGIQFEINSLDRKEYASAGMNLKFNFNLVIGSENFYPGTTTINKEILKIPHTWVQARFQYENFFLQLQRMKIGIFTHVSYSAQAFFSNYTSSILSAFTFSPVPESGILFLPEYRSNKFGVIGLKNVYQFSKKFNFRLEGYARLSSAITKDPVTQKVKQSSNLHFHSLFSSALVYHTPIGPISTEFNYYGAESEPFSFLIKFGYLIFNRRPF